MNNDVQTTVGSDYKDRSTGLIVFGIFEIFIGAFFALEILMTIFGTLASHGLNPTFSMDARTLIPGILMYVILAVWFIWMGIGSIQARRWARALMLVTSWIWFITGIVSTPLVIAFLPGMFNQMGNSRQMPQEFYTVVMYVTIGFMAVFYIIVPGVFVLFYGSKDTKATCENRDPQVRWTDKCPLPVLACSLVSAVTAFSLLLNVFYGAIIPFFGSVLSGIAGAGVALIGTLLLIYVAWGMYRSRINAWWCAVLSVVVWGVSVGLTYSHGIPMALFDRMHLPAQQIEIVRQAVLSHSSMVAVFSWLYVVLALAYLLYVRKYFIRPAEIRGV